MNENIVPNDDVQDAVKRDIKKIGVEIPVDVKNKVKTEDIKEAFGGGMNERIANILDVEDAAKECGIH